MSRNIQDVHRLLNQEQIGRLSFEIRQTLSLRTHEMNDEDYDAAVALLGFMDTKPNGAALSGEIISFLSASPHSFSLKRVSDLLKYLLEKKFIFLGSAIARHHVLGNLPIQLESM